MTTIKATCPLCGDVDLTPAELTILVADRLGWSSYCFTCASCAQVVRKPADDEVVSLLTQAGVRVEHVDVPTEFLEAHSRTQSAKPMTQDEILDFSLWLGASDDIVGALVEDG